MGDALDYILKSIGMAVLLLGFLWLCLEVYLARKYRK